MKFKLGEFVDARDERGNSLNAQVIKIAPPYVTVRFTGYSQKYDRVLAENSPELLKQWISPSQSICSPGNRLDVKVEGVGWLQARVVKTEGNRVFVHFVGYKTVYDTWVELDKVLPVGSKSRAYGVGNTLSGQSEEKVRQNIQLQIRQKVRQRALLFKEELAKRYIEVVSVAGDGNCLFRSFSHQLYGTQDHHALIRQHCVQLIQLQRDFFKDFVHGPVDEYIERKKRLGQWGDDLQIQAFTELYCLPVQIYLDSFQPIKTFHENNPNCCQPVRLLYSGASHYQSLLLKNGQPQQPEQFRPLLKYRPGEFEQNALKMLKKGLPSQAWEVIKASRLQFQKGGLQEAIEQSMRQGEEEQMQKIEQDLCLLASREQQQKYLQDQVRQLEEAELQRAVEQSRQGECLETEESQLRRVVEQSKSQEQAELQRAMQRSRREHVMGMAGPRTLLQMGYPEWAVVMAVDELGVDDPDALLEFVLKVFQ